MITAAQIRGARAMLDWNAEKLSKMTGLEKSSISNIERGNTKARDDSLEKILQAFTNNGIEFIGDQGVQLKTDRITTLYGENVFFKVLDDVITTLKNTPKPEALFSCVNDKLSPPIVIENYRRLRKAGITMRSTIQEGDTYLMGKLDEYRYLPEEFFHNSTVVTYGDKVATMILDPDSKSDVGAVIILNPHVAASQRNQFNLIWSLAKSPTKTDAKVRYDE